MYLIDSYDTYSASALGFLVFTRYVVAGGVTVAGGPIYEALGVQYILTILGSISAVMALVPYLLYFYGPMIRKKSKYAVNIDTEWRREKCDRKEYILVYRSVPDWLGLQSLAY